MIQSFKLKNLFCFYKYVKIGSLFSEVLCVPCKGNILVPIADNSTYNISLMFFSSQILGEVAIRPSVNIKVSCCFFIHVISIQLKVTFFVDGIII